VIYDLDERSNLEHYQCEMMILVFWVFRNS